MTITLDDLKVDEVRQGSVESLSQFGAFVDLGGVLGFIHHSELADHPVENPSDVLRVRQPVAVKVVGIDKERQRVSLSLKEAQEQKGVRRS